MKARGARPNVIEVMQDLWSLTHALEARSKWMKRVYGVSGPQFLLIRIVGKNPGCSPSQAARHLRLHAGTVTRLAAGLQVLGMIRRGGHGRDRRRVRLTLTGRGRWLNRFSAGTVQQALERTLGEARAREVTAATALIRRLADELAPDGGNRARAKDSRPGMRRRPGGTG